MKKHIICKFKWLTAIIAVVLFAASCEINANDPDYTPKMVEVDPILNSTSEYIIVLGDLQVYTTTPDTFSYFGSTMDWIWSQQQHGKNIKCILQTGDVTENNLRSQYDIFLEYTAPVAANIPYIACTGNHDYDWTDGSLILDRYSTLFSEYTAFESVRSKIIDQFEEGRMENIIVENSIMGQRYDIISLEFGPRKEVVEWVRAHVEAHPERQYILMTHEHLTTKGERISSGAYSSRQLRNTTATSPEQLWTQLVKDNNNIVCVLCGHNGFSTHLFSENSSGRDVAQILFNLQYQANGGDGWVQIWEFPMGKDYVNVDVYNTITRQYHPEKPRFQFKYKY